MRLGTVGALIGWLIIFLSLALLTPIPFCLYYGDRSWAAFLVSSALGLVAGGGLAWAFVSEKEIGHREGFAIVTFSWAAAAVIGAFPYYFSGAIPGFADALFESMSGFTTTGSTILREVEVLGPGLLFWRSLTHWLGGMGIIVLSLAILPILGIGGMQLFQAEMPGPTKDRLAPRIQDTARILWGVYLVMTVAEVVLLMLAGMDFFDAVCHSFATLATGGFSTHTASVAYFQNSWIEWIIIFFMILAGINFTLHYRLFTGNFRSWGRSEELRFYLAGGVLATVVICCANMWDGVYTSWEEGFRIASFQVWSIVTTTGFGTADFDLWTPLCKVILISLMFLGGMAGSTAGGIKQVRVLLFGKFTRFQVKKLIHPRSVDTVKLDGHRVHPDIVQAILGYLSLYLSVFVAATLLVTGLGLDMISGATAVIATLNNVGPGLGTVGPARNFADLSDPTKLVLTFCMLAGRLELYTVAVLFVPSYWKGVHGPAWRWSKDKR